MILAALKQATRVHHEQLERRLGLPSSVQSHAGYLALLRQLLGYYAPLEARLAPWLCGGRQGLDYAARRKAPLLQLDLSRLTGHANAVVDVPCCSDLPNPAEVSSALGCLYVVEGATLGGQLIARDLAQRFGWDVRSGAAFFSSYGRQVGPMWRAFGLVLEQDLANATARSRAICAARDTFATLERWLLPEEMPEAAETGGDDIRQEMGGSDGAGRAADPW